MTICKLKLLTSLVVYVQSTSYEVTSSAFVPVPPKQIGNMTFTSNVDEDVDSINWTHSLVINMVRSTNETLFVQDVSSMYGFFGNGGGAYSLMALCFALLYAVRSPEVETEFQIPGFALLLKLLELCRLVMSYLPGWLCRRRNVKKFAQFQLASRGSDGAQMPA